MAHAQSISQWKKFVIYVVMFFYFAAISMVDYIVNEYTQDRLKTELFPNSTFSANLTGCQATNHSDPQYIRYAKVQEKTAEWSVYYALASRLPAILMNLLLPSYTDSFGRRFLFNLTCIGAFVKSGLIIISIYANLSFGFIVVAYGLEALSGGVISFFAVNIVYFADITSNEKERVVAVTIAEGIVLLLLTFGSLANGFLVQNTGFLLPIILCAAFSAVATLVSLTLLPETIAPEMRIKPKNPIRTIFKAGDFYTSKEFRGQRMTYMLLLAAFFFLELNANNRSGIETIYLLGMPFCWSPLNIGYFTALRSGAQGLFGLLLLKLFQRCLSSDLIAIISTVVSAGTLVQEALARSEVLLYLVTVPAIFSFLTVPVIRATMSSITPPDKQGSLFSSVAVVEVTSALIATLSENAVYSATVAVSNSFVFFVMAGFSSLACLLLCIYKWKAPGRSYDKLQENIN